MSDRLTKKKSCDTAYRIWNLMKFGNRPDRGLGSDDRNILRYSTKFIGEYTSQQDISCVKQK